MMPAAGPVPTSTWSNVAPREVCEQHHRMLARAGLSLLASAVSISALLTRRVSVRATVVAPEGVFEMAHYAVLVYADDSAHAPDATTEDLDVYDQHAAELAASGSMLASYALLPRDFATSVRAGAITDGPFVDTKEIIAGFYILEAPDLDAALAIARLNPVVANGGGLEIRPVHSGGPVTT